MHETTPHTNCPDDMSDKILLVHAARSPPTNNTCVGLATKRNYAFSAEPQHTSAASAEIPV